MLNMESENRLCEVCGTVLTPKPNGKFNQTCGKICHIALRTKNTAKTMKDNGTYQRLGIEHKKRMSDLCMKKKHSQAITVSLNTPNKDGILPKKKAGLSLSKTLKNNPNIIKDREPKKRKSMELSGRWIPIDQLDLAVAYRLKVHSVTMSQPLNQLKNFDKRGPSGNPLNDNHHIDHIFSVSEGFKLGISPEIIGHISNLRMIHHSLNCKKGGKSDMSVEELIHRYNNY